MHYWPSVHANTIDTGSQHRLESLSVIRWHVSSLWWTCLASTLSLMTKDWPRQLEGSTYASQHLYTVQHHFCGAVSILIVGGHVSLKLKVCIKVLTPKSWFGIFCKLFKCLEKAVRKDWDSEWQDAWRSSIDGQCHCFLLNFVFFLIWVTCR